MLKKLQWLLAAGALLVLAVPSVAMKGGPIGAVQDAPEKKEEPGKEGGGKGRKKKNKKDSRSGRKEGKSDKKEDKKKSESPKPNAMN